MSKRVYELSKELGLSNKELLSLLKELKLDISSTISSVSHEVEEQVTFFLENKKNKKTKGDSSPKSRAAVSPMPNVSKNKKKQSREINIKNDNSDNIAENTVDSVEIIVKPMTVGEFAEKANKPATEVILTLLLKGKVAAKNQIIQEETVELLANEYGLTAVKPKKKESEVLSKMEDSSLGTVVERLPIVVVVGHVDHGKTTLLDYIRNTRVTAKEKGGITQHLGAYEVPTGHGNIVFLDTPGHEAFSIMRARGINVADIVVLVVAADDSVMPQTIEAIKKSKEVGLPIIVAVNKIDKASEAQLEKVKSDLSQHDLLPEEWGGQTVLVPISAKTGEGVNDLLEVLALQSELMELKSNISIPAKGYILESHIEKGRGPVATVIILQGTLSIKDYFICGETTGKVTSLVNSSGKNLKTALPSIPVKVSGFSMLPQVGDIFRVVSKAEAKKGVTESPLRAPVATVSTGEQSINLIIKADNASSKEAVVNSIEKLNKKVEVDINMVASSIGSVTESDITLAADTQSIIYGFTVKVEPKAKSLAAKLDVEIKIFDIIYKLLEDLEDLAESKKKIVYISKKIGEASVLKVFDIKNLGVIAGSLVKSGMVSKDSTVKIYRGKQKIGEGPIKSLQKEKKTVKEVQAGFECGFLVDGFTAWEIDDRVEFYLEVPE